MKKIIDAIKKMFGKSDKTSDSSSSSGFTLIELLVVIAVIGVLAAAVLIAIDPIQQLARGRDSGRKTSISQLGNAMQSYLTSNSDSAATLPTGAQWTAAAGNILVTSGDLKVFPPTPGGTAITCSQNSRNNFCYATSGNDFVIYTGMESKSEWQKCGATAGNAWYTYQSSTGRAGVVCGVGQPSPTSTQL